jgi:hypothetical protein
MEKLISIWEWLNYKKVVIGSLMLLVAQALKLLEFPEYAAIIEQIATIINGTGGVVTTVGLLHKLEKVFSKPKIKQ